MPIFAERLSLLRKEHKITREVLCESLPVGVRTYQRYENGEREPTASTIVALADYYHVTTDYLLGRTEKR